MSRFRFNPALVISSMVHGTIEKTVDETTGTMMRKTNLGEVLTEKKVSAPGCRMTFCREKEQCHCSCKRCAFECINRKSSPRGDA